MSYVSPKDRFEAEGFEVLDIHEQFVKSTDRKRKLIERILSMSMPNPLSVGVMIGMTVAVLLALLALLYLFTDVQITSVSGLGSALFAILFTTGLFLGLNHLKMRRFYDALDDTLYEYYRDYPEPTFDHKVRIKKVSRWFKAVCQIPIDDQGESYWATIVVSPVEPSLMFVTDPRNT